MVDSVAVLAMRRGEANKIDVGLAEELVASLEAAAVAGARAIVLTGHGQVFSRGVDLDTVVENGHDHLELLMRAAVETFAAVFSCPLPVVAAINGDALAGGCVVACACDVRVMSEGSASFGVSPRLIGPFPPIAVEILRFHAGNAAAQRLLFGGVVLNARDALAAGLVEEVAAPDRLHDRAIAIAQTLADAPADSFRLLKQELRGPALTAAAAGRERHAAAFAASWSAREVLMQLGLPGPIHTSPVQDPQVPTRVPRAVRQPRE
jgi:enoyl-CoA hydratase